MEMGGVRPMRSGSVASDVQSASGMSVLGSAPTGQPAPAYIASTGASQLITAELGHSVAISPSALALINNFLDQVLFNILATAHSNNLSSLKNAVPVVLKPRLGKSALNAADEELREYLEESDDEETASAPPSRSGFDLDLAWKLARLRCMVYTRLGDLEEEDEEEYIEQEDLDQQRNPARNAVQLGPASAIFLTSVLEYLGEQALYYAAQHAQKRIRSSKLQEESTYDNGPNTDAKDHFVVEEADLSVIGRESPLSRLWRSWRRTTRSPREVSSRPMSPESSAFPNELNNLGVPIATIAEEQQSSTKAPAPRSPSQVPLPMSMRDVDEIEVPGLAPEIVDEGEMPLATPVTERGKRRPLSMMITPLETAMPLTPKSADEAPEFQDRNPLRPKPRHTRSYSLPTPAQTPFTTPRDNTLSETSTVPVTQYDHADSTAQISGTPGEASALPHSHPETNNGLARDDDDQQVGKVAAAVSAVAGALGLGAAYTAAKSRPESSNEAQAKPEARRTIAEEMVGPSSDVPSPHDAITGASITSVGDFDSIHVPVQQPSAEKSQTPTADVSDPEDLALSSADEEAHEAGHHQEKPEQKRSQSLATSSQANGTGGGATFFHDSDDEEDTKKQIESNVESSPSARKPPVDYATKSAHRQATVYEDASVAELPVTSSDLSTPSTGVTGLASAQTPVSPIYEKDVVRHSPAIPVMAYANQIPPRLSSTDRPSSSHAHANSKSSHYSHHSKNSSSSSKLLGFDREQQASLARNSQMVTMPAAAVPDSPSRKRNHLKAQSDDDESRRTLDSNDDAKKKSLELLINSDETLHYTLTPSSARGEQFPVAPKPKTQTQELAEFFKTTKPPTEESIQPKTARTVMQTGLNGLRGNPSTSDAIAQKKKVIPSTQNVVPLAASPTKYKNPLVTPRDPRIDRDTTRDLADYARSTGPESPTQLPKPLAPSTSQSAPGSSLGIAPKTGSKSSNSRLKFQARDAAPSRHAESSDLVDFIREGPPRAPGDHRIDRNVAPFRRTMDSEDLNGLAPSQEIDQNGTNSVASTQNSSVIQSSLNSRTALLESTRKSNAATTNGIRPNAGASLRQTALAEEEAGPKRTRTRVRDPYAIDDSDDDLDGVVAAPRPVTQEESLIDFLRNTAPPPSMAPQPIMTTGSSAASSSTIRREPSNQGLRDRLLRKTSLTALSRKGSQSNNSSKQTEQPPAYNRSTKAPRDESPHLTQVGSKLDSYRPTSSTHASHVEKNRHKARTVPRDPRTTGNTSDLADYLRNSGPSGRSAAPIKSAEPIKDESGFMRFFSRRRSVKN